MLTPIQRIVPLLAALVAAPVCAEPVLHAVPTDRPPVIDGVADEAAWARATPLTVKDGASDIPITLRALHDGERIYLLARFPDPDESRLHKPLRWNPQQGYYEVGPQREDTLVLKWNLSRYPVDLTLHGDTPYQADVWFWKAHRTDPMGYADDKHQLYGESRMIGARPITTASGRLFYLVRNGDPGTPAYEAALVGDYAGDLIPGYRHREPSGDRADIRAKGEWREGYWSIEFARRLDTGNVDDVKLEVGGSAQFAVSRYEVAGRPVNPQQDQPPHGAGEVGEVIRLILD